MRLALLAFLCIPLAACVSATSRDLPPEARSLSGHLSRLERQHLEAIAFIHGGRSIIQRARESGALADNVEWWVAGPSEILPFAGTWRGIEGVAEFQKKLSETMRYDKVELQRYIVSGDDVAAIFVGEGVARATGKPFRSEIVRLYTFASGKVVRVRNYYDTAAYIKAVRGE
ncbi:MAG TPA: nuclear transport factor 2 family protein [Thermoanaerobaculia bacterium]|nr:nuclear transport factor 2 family protein [Thermoanaerobaculia bacterium]